MPRCSVSLVALLLLFSLLWLTAGPTYAQTLSHEKVTISSGAAALDLARKVTDLPALNGSPIQGVGPGAAAFGPGVNFLANNFDDNATENGGYVFIPPDPIGAAGPDRVISVVNVMIECRNKTGTLMFRDALRDFFSSVSTLGTFTFDPKIVYDHYENRFVVVALERWQLAAGDPSNESRILVAVSKTSTPATATTADWWMFEINSKISIGGFDHWADYPGFEVDEEVVYITANMFPFNAGNGGVRLWIVHKGVVGGFYAGGTPTVTVHDPVVGGFVLTTMPAQVHGAGGAGAGIGTYLVGYDGLTYGGAGGLEVMQIIRVDNPTGAVSFNNQLVNMGDLEDIGGSYGWPVIPDAPQLGTTYTIEVNDRRTLDAVWRNNKLWVTTTIDPSTTYDATNNGQATAHWLEFDTTTPASVTLIDQGNVGGEDIAAGTWTFFPSLAVNGNDDVAIGFSASAASMYAGGYYGLHEASAAPGTIGPSGTVQTGLDWYYRAFGGTRNRWGDYSGASVDPSDDTTFWIFNEYAATRGTPISGEDGRWGTAWASVVQQQTPTDWGDAPDPTYPTLSVSGGANHTIVQGVQLGALIDAEPDGIPHPNALGDDLTNLADEDGVTWVTALIPGQPAQMDVVASVAGWVDAWIDFNANGTWADPGEQIYSGPVGPGLNSIPFNVPAGIAPGPTFARVRYNTLGPLPYTGPASDGEVEDYEVFIEQGEEIDWGDAPDQPYPTLAVNNGANHVIVPGVFMGALIDAEADGQPDPTATGDDLANLADEDGVVWVTPLVPGQNAQMDVTVSMAGWVDAWVDFNVDGDWKDAGEQIYSGPVGLGLNSLSYAVPASAVSGQSFARVRYNTAMVALPTTGSASDGEVEDYGVFIEESVQLDWGDAPDPTYRTLAVNNGPSHVIVQGVFMGALIDAEPDGQPDPNALGDDNNNLPDEDGAVIVIPPAPGSPCQIDVTVSVTGWVDLWIDFDMDGVFTAVDLMWSGNVSAGLNSLVFSTPLFAQPGAATFMRVRYNTGGVALQPWGPASDGEVEDYELRVEDVTGIDFGDAPDPTYPTLLASNGARHAILPNVFMGALIDAEPDGQPHPNALGDDLANLADEDGVNWVTALVPGNNAQMDVTISVGGWVDAWIDFDQSGVWDASEQVFSGPLPAGLNPIVFPVPAAAVAGPTFARVRYNLNGPLSVKGYAPDGEVEDYQVNVEEEQQLDWGDAPDPTYQTLAVSNGPSHVIVPGVLLGALIDGEPDGQPDPSATGDDLANLPDEDGVVVNVPPAPGSPCQLTVTASVAGRVDIWIDFDLDGVFTAADAVYSAAVAAGPNVISFGTPVTATPGTTFMRVRYNTGGPLPPTGPAQDGEVEDYGIQVDELKNVDFGDAPDQPYPTLLVNNGARHGISAGVFMGALIDAEPDGQPNASATGDDIANLADEDGVAWVTPIIPTLVSQMDVTVSVNGWVDAWVDFDQNGVWDPTDLIYSGAVNAGLNNILFPVPATAVVGQTYARVRYNTLGVALATTGYASDGEVEDYQVQIDEYIPTDWGDAPDPTYQTLAANGGPNHVIVQGVQLGALIDAELDGQPHPQALGDDLNNLADEDGVFFATPFATGMPVQLNVTASVAGQLDLWIDFDLDGVFTGADLQYSGPVVAGVNAISASVPYSVPPGTVTFLRARFNTGGPLPPTGPASDGEVEDYEVRIEAPENVDFGDAPDPSYPTRLASNGARHVIVPGFFMGALIDAEPDGQPDPTATGDDLANLADEDGVAWVTQLVPGMPAQFDVTVSANGWVDAWVDFDQNGTWDPADQIYSGNVVAGLNSIPFTVPWYAAPGFTFARVRYNGGGMALTPDGYAQNGEVEDYRVRIDEPGVMDYGDAPDPTYPTLFASNGARHRYDSAVYMGSFLDLESDGQPGPNAQGDDAANIDDEDGLTWVTPMVPDSTAQVNVTVSVAGYLDMWIDYNRNGSWSDAGEQVYSGTVSAGANAISFTVPNGASLGTTYLRARYNTVGALPVTGYASNGEVEDHQVWVHHAVTGVPGETGRPFGILLGAPNPFGERFTIEFATPAEGHVDLKIYNMNGQLVSTLVDAYLPAGDHVAHWSGRSERFGQMPAGIYFYRLTFGNRTDTRKVIYTR